VTRNSGLGLGLRPVLEFDFVLDPGLVLDSGLVDNKNGSISPILDSKEIASWKEMERSIRYPPFSDTYDVILTKQNFPSVPVFFFLTSDFDSDQPLRDQADKARVQTLEETEIAFGLSQVPFSQHFQHFLGTNVANTLDVAVEQVGLVEMEMEKEKGIRKVNCSSPRMVVVHMNF